MKKPEKRKFRTKNTPRKNAVEAPGRHANSAQELWAAKSFHNQLTFYNKTMAECSKATGIPQSTLNFLRDGRRVVRQDVYWILADYFTALKAAKKRK